jgi:hypothetical protein
MEATAWEWALLGFVIAVTGFGPIWIELVSINKRFTTLEERLNNKLDAISGRVDDVRRRAA